MAPFPPSRVARATVLGLALACLAAPLSATWSIVVVNTRTGEVGIGGATCLSGFNLPYFSAVVRVGEGAASAQSTIDAGPNRVFIWNQMSQGTPPDQILAGLAATDPGHQARQYGIVDFDHAPATFTGTNTGLANPGVAGVAGDLRYAIQGNLLAGDLVVLAAESALLNTNGDLSQKLLAAMEAARATGGDGRCSCPQQVPTACGAPPASFTYSAFTAYVIVARMGDADGVCTPAAGCANGGYFLFLNHVSGPGGPEPVLALQSTYALWRLGMTARADHVLTRVRPAAQALPADGVSTTTVDVELRTIDDLPLPPGVRSSLLLAPVGTPAALASDPVKVAHDRFRFTLQAGTTPGEARYALTVRHNPFTVRLWPDLVVRVDPVTDLHSGRDTLSAAEGGSVPLTLNLGAAQAGRPYLILGSAAGTSPGVAWEGGHLPLNSDLFFRRSFQEANQGSFQDTQGVLDAAGRAQAHFVVAPPLLDHLVGRRIDWCGIVRPPAPAPVVFTQNAGFDVVP